MAPPAGKIADYARDELPETWKALSALPDGDGLLNRRLTSTMLLLFGVELDSGAQDELPELVALYAGKKLAMSLITPGIDYWSKQKISLGARSETGAYKDRAEDLRQLRKDMTADLASLWPDVLPLLPDVLTGRGNVDAPRVTELANAHTSSPYDFENAWGPPGGTTGTTTGGTG